MTPRALRLALFLTCVAIPVAWSVWPAGAQEAAPTIRAMLQTTMGGTVGLAPVRVAAERAGCQVVRSGAGELVFQFAGTSNNYAYVRTDGGITIASTRSIRRLEDMDLLDADLVRVYAFIEQVSGKIPDEIKHACLYYNPVYYLSDPQIYKRVVFPPGKYDGTLIVPNCEIRQARITVMPAPGMTCTVKLRERRLYGEFGWYDVRRKSFDVTRDLVYGSHEFWMAGYDIGGCNAAVAVEAITSPTPDKVYFNGNGVEKAVVTRVLPLSGATPRASEPGLPDQGTEQAANAPATAAPPKPEGPAVSRAALRDVMKGLEGAASTDDPKVRAMLAQPALWLADYYLRKGAHDAALPHLEAAVRMAPDSALAHAALARAFKAQGDSKRFAEEIGHATQLDSRVPVDQPPVPDDAVTFALGDVEAVAKRVEAAQGDAKASALAAAAKAVSALAHCGLGQALLADKTPGPALDEFRAARALAPDSVGAHWGCAEAAWGAQDTDAAVKEIQAAYRLDPRDERVQDTLSRLGAALGRDITPPRVWFVEPHDGDSFEPPILEVKFAAEDEVSVLKVTLYVDDKKIDEYFPRLQRLECKMQLRRGSHTLRAEAEDTSRNTSTTQITITRR